MDVNYLKYCPNCLGNGVVDNKGYYDDGTPISTVVLSGTYTMCNGLVDMGNRTHCVYCGTELQLLWITVEEWRIIQQTTTDLNVIYALNELKNNNPVEFGNQMAQYKQTAESIKQTKMIQYQQSPSTINTPKCPTCGSTNIKKISATKRWIGTGLFGLGSSDIGKTMQCNNCGYKF